MDIQKGEGGGTQVLVFEHCGMQKVVVVVVLMFRIGKNVTFFPRLPKYFSQLPYLKNNFRIFICIIVNEINSESKCLHTYIHTFFSLLRY